MKILYFSIILLCTTVLPAIAQHHRGAPTRQDTLRGSITPEREWWDLVYYHLDIELNPEDSTLFGSNLVMYKVLKPGQVMQIDLQPPMKITSVTHNGEKLTYKQDGNAWFIRFPEAAAEGQTDAISIEYGGKPQVSKRPPWSGGVTYKTDASGKPFIATSNQGDGASLWWPCKDHMYDEPDSMLISVTVPKGLMDVSNGRLRNVTKAGKGRKTYHWFVGNPINNYGVSLNIADYAHFSETYDGENGPLDCDYYVLKENLEKAKEQFREVPRMLKAFEHWFGPYPFYKDSYKLVEAPYLGMEHQSAVTYGNAYGNGYLGRDLSGTGWGLKFDFIIVHESGHEWFANNITYKDMADMWIHEGFTAYSENLFVEYYYGKEAGAEYVLGTRQNIMNDIPIIGPYGVNRSGSGDEYYKGANMLHMIRQMVNDDEKWREVLRGLNKTFYHQTVTTDQIENYMVRKTGLDLAPVFDQYLRDIRIPVLEYFFRNGKLNYRWNNVVENFHLAIPVRIGNNRYVLKATPQWQSIEADDTGDLKTDINYYVAQMKIKMDQPKTD